MKLLLLVLAGCIGKAVATPTHLRNSPKTIQSPTKEKIVAMLDDIQRWIENGGADRIQELIKGASERDIWDIILIILHSLGYTDEEIIEFIQYIIEVVESVEKQLTYTDNMKMENAGMSISISISEPNKFNWNVFLGNVYTLKKVVYPYVPEELQVFMDNIEEAGISFWRNINEQ